jgi:hypothetical protein
MDWESDDFTIVGLSSAYTYNGAHEYADDLTGVLGTPTALTGKTALVGGVADADDVSYPGVALGQNVVAWAIYQYTGSLATSPLVYYADENDNGTPIDIDGDGSAIVILWSSSADKIFRI